MSNLHALFRKSSINILLQKLHVKCCWNWLLMLMLLLQTFTNIWNWLKCFFSLFFPPSIFCGFVWPFATLPSFFPRSSIWLEQHLHFARNLHDHTHTNTRNRKREREIQVFYVFLTKSFWWWERSCTGKGYVTNFNPFAVVVVVAVVVGVDVVVVERELRK